MTFSNKQTPSAISGKYTCKITFRGGTTYTTPPATASGGSVTCTFPENDAQVKSADFKTKDSFSGGYAKTSSADGGKIKVTVKMPSGSSCGGSALSYDQITGGEGTPLKVELRNEIGISVGVGAFSSGATVCWNLPAYELITPTDFYHGDQQNKYGNNKKNTYVLSLGLSLTHTIGSHSVGASVSARVHV